MRVFIIVSGSSLYCCILDILEWSIFFIGYRLTDCKRHTLVWSRAHFLKVLDLEIDSLAECDSKLPPFEASHLGSNRVKASVFPASCYLCVLRMNTMSWSLHIHPGAWHETGSTSIRRSQYVSRVKLIRSFYFLVTVRDLSQSGQWDSTLGLLNGEADFSLLCCLWPEPPGSSAEPESRANSGETESRNQSGDIIWTRNQVLIQTTLSFKTNLSLDKSVILYSSSFGLSCQLPANKNIATNIAFILLEWLSLNM